MPFLPDNEIHEIGLLYINYEIVLRGYKSIYLGQTVPLENLNEVMHYFDNLYFISYFTVEPNKDHIDRYIKDFAGIAKNYSNPNLWILGRQVQYVDEKNLPSFIKTFTSINQILERL